MISNDSEVLSISDVSRVPYALRWSALAPIGMTPLLLALTSHPLAAAPIHAWSRCHGILSVPHASDVATNASGEIAISGEFQGSIDLGGGPLYSQGVDDCFVAKFDASGDEIWSRSFGNFDWDSAEAIALGADGSVVVAGTFRYTVDFGGGPLTSAGNQDLFVVRYDARGNHLWSRRFGDSGQQYAVSVAMDAQGGVLVAGYFDGTIDFGGGALVNAGWIDIFAAKLDAGGEHVWSRRFGDAGPQVLYSGVCDDAGHVALTGSFGGSIDFGGDVLTSAGSHDIFIAKLDPAGQLTWSRAFGDAALDRGNGVAFDESGNLVATGFFSGTIDLGAGLVTATEDVDAYLVSFDAAGMHRWSRTFGGTRDQVGSSLVTDASGNVHLAGFFEDSIDLGGGLFTSTGTEDLFLASFESDGDLLWSRAFESVDYGKGIAVAVGSDAQTLFIGGFHLPVDLGGGPLVLGATENAFLAELDENGAHVWSRALGQLSGDGTGTAIAALPSGGYVVAGGFEGTIDFGTGPLTSTDLRYDTFLASFDEGGALRWVHRYGGPDWDYAIGVGADADGNIFVTGIALGDVDLGGGSLPRSAGIMFLAAYDRDGEHQWSQRLGGTSSVQPYALEVDRSGNVIVTGSFIGTVALGGEPLASAGDTDIFVASYERNGAHRWSRRFGGAAWDVARAMALDEEGRPLLLGTISGTVDFGGGPLAGGFASTFLLKLDGSAQHLWSRALSSTEEQHPASADVDAAGNVYIAGSFQGSIDLGGGPLVSAGGKDLFVASYDAAGDYRWGWRQGTVFYELPTSVAVGSSGDLIVTGHFYDRTELGGGPLYGQGQGDIFLASYDSDGQYRWSEGYGDGEVQGSNAIAADAAGGFAITGGAGGFTDFGGGPVYGSPVGGVFAARFTDGGVAASIGDAEIDTGIDTEIDTEIDTAIDTAAELAVDLEPSFPNPFGSSTTLEYRLAARAITNLNVYDSTGRLVRRLHQGPRDAGHHRATWDGRDELGRPVANGEYFCRLETPAGTTARKILRIR